MSPDSCARLPQNETQMSLLIELLRGWMSSGGPWIHYPSDVTMSIGKELELGSVLRPKARAENGGMMSYGVKSSGIVFRVDQTRYLSSPRDDCSRSLMIDRKQKKLFSQSFKAKDLHARRTTFGSPSPSTSTPAHVYNYTR
ncbi:hypothetical protein WG66_011419 [Moniliophthora roreri]|nr:hypothetical protein WG66_011419 [Moniliophthora roreri]